MKIGIVLSNTPAHSETFFISKIKGLQKKGFEVVLIVGRQQSNFNLCPVLVQPKINSFYFIITLLKTLWFCIASYRVLKRFIQLERGSGSTSKSILKKIIVNLHILKIRKLDWLHFGFATQAIGRENIAESIGAKMAVSLRGFDISIFPLKYPHCYQLLWNKIDKLHVISNDLLDLAYENGCSTAITYQKITPAIDINTFNAIFPKKKETRINFLTIGRLHWKKGYEATLLALQLVKSKGVAFQYTIIGSGKEYERIAYAIYDLDLHHEVKLLGELSQTAVIENLKKTDLYIQYSIQEGFGNAVLEAQAMGILPLVSDAEGLSENVIDTVTGWVVEKNNPKLLAQKIEEILSVSEDKKQEMRITGIQRVRKEFNLEKQENEFVNFYTN
jgi:colanic acid/amylovoran biosynthesis glycosyltransferase